MAVYTLNEPTKEVQNVAYSLDNGTSYIEYQGNPVIDLQNPNFRDPKVFWYAPGHRWIMAVALPGSRGLVLWVTEFEELALFELFRSGGI